MAWFEGFQGKAVLVTGASSGIGRATAVAFGAAGARVALVARRRDALQEVAAAIQESGGEALVVPGDVTRPEDVRECMRAARAGLGGVDVVVNNAGILIPAPVTELEPADLAAMFAVNVFGALAVMQESVRIMRERGDGCIVNVASLAGRRGVTPLGGYCASKFALVGLTEALRVELHGSGIHVALVMPGVIDTPMAQSVEDSEQFAALWPPFLNMPPSWVVWAVFAAARFRLVEISVPPGAATLEKLAALAPGVTDSVLHWGTQATQWLNALVGGARAGRPGGPAPRREP